MFHGNIQIPAKLTAYLVVLVAIFTVLFAAYSTAIALPFAYHDDYYFFTYDRRDSYEFHPQALFFPLVGREGYVPLAFLMAKLIHVVGDLSQVRAIFVGILAITGTLMTAFFGRLGLPRWQGATLSVSILLLPGFQVGELWVTMAPFSIALLLSFIGGWLALLEGERLANGAQRFSWRTLWGMTLPFALALAATFIYQPWAMFYLLPVCAYLIFTPLGVMRKTLTVPTTVGTSLSAALGTYFLLHRYVFLPSIYAKHPETKTFFDENPTFAFRVTTHIGEKITFLFHDVLLHAANLWNIYLSEAWALVVIAIIVMGAAARLPHTWRRLRIANMFPELGSRILILAILGVGSVLPVVVAAGGHSGFRVVVPLSAMIVLLLGSTIRSISGLLEERMQSPQLLSGALMGCICALAAALAWSNVRDSALNAALEFQGIKASLRDYLADRTHPADLRFVLANPAFSTNLQQPVAGVGEFNLNSAAFWQDVPWMFRAALLDLGVPPSQACIIPKTSTTNAAPEHCIIVSVTPYGSRS